MGQKMSTAPATISISVIRQNAHARAIDEKAVVALAESIQSIGLKTPITVRPTQIVVNCQLKDGYEVVSGQHRLEAVKMLGLEEIECFVTEDDETACRMWEISENLHRAELPQMERDRLVAEWCRLVGKENKGVQVGHPQPRYEKRGESESARQLGLSRQDVIRAVKVASITPEAQQAAHDVGLADNRSALLEAASKPAEEQAAYLRERAVKKEMKLAPEPMDDFEAREAWLTKGLRWWNSGSQEWRQEFLRRS